MSVDQQAELIKRRAEALVMAANLNAANHGGDAAIAGADLMMAFVLHAMRSGADPVKARDAMFDNAVAACDAFFGKKGMH